MNAVAKLFDLSGRTALVTGSSQGIGLALARGLADAGAAVVLNGRDAAKLDGRGTACAARAPPCCAAPSTSPTPRP